MLCRQHCSLRLCEQIQLRLKLGSGDHQFLGILACCRDISLAMTSVGIGTGIIQEEIMLLDINPPKDSIDQFWICQTEEQVKLRAYKIS